MTDAHTIRGTYGSAHTPCDVIVAQDSRRLLCWYVVAGSININATYEDLEDGVDVELVEDVDHFTVGRTIETVQDLIDAIDS